MKVRHVTINFRDEARESVFVDSIAGRKVELILVAGFGVGVHYGDISLAFPYDVIHSVTYIRKRWWK